MLNGYLLTEVKADIKHFATIYDKMSSEEDLLNCFSLVSGSNLRVLAPIFETI